MSAAGIFLLSITRSRWEVEAVEVEKPGKKLASEMEISITKSAGNDTGEGKNAGTEVRSMTSTRVSLLGLVCSCWGPAATEVDVPKKTMPMSEVKNCRL